MQAERTAQTQVTLYIKDSEVAVLLSVSRSTVWRWVRTGILPKPIKIGGATRFDRAKVLSAISGSPG